jgi:exopolyphosphatase/guanosine-5'-triphosphate,3'-diphosphate pyrophosphatase
MRLLDILVTNASPEMRESLQHAAMLLDIGRSIDYYERHRNAAVIVAGADLQGFSQRGIAWLFAVLMHAADAANRIKSLRPMLDGADEEAIERAATLLLLADEIERRSLPGQPLTVHARLVSQAMLLGSEGLSGWRPRSLGDRFRRAFRRDLRIEED